MQVYTNDLLTAVITFPFIALAITIPYMIYQYRKFGSIPPLRSLIVYSFVFYLLCAYFLVILPLPEDHTIVVPYAQVPQLVPFNFVREFLAQTTFSLQDPSTWLATLKDPYVYEAIFNVALLVPLGMYLRYYFRRTWWQTLILGFCTTLFFEVSQITGLFGLYAHPYRLFDVDDLMLNTLGAMVGYLVVSPAMQVLPDIRVVNEEAREEGVHASLMRRALSFALDLLFATISTIALAFFLFITDGQTALIDAGTNAAYISLGLEFLPLLVFFVVIPTITQGQTLGQMILKLVMVRPDASRAHWYQFLGRYGLLYMFFIAPLVLVEWIMNLDVSATNELSPLVNLITEAKLFLLILWVACLVIWVISIAGRAARSHKNKTPLIMLNGLLSDTRVMTLEGVERIRDRSVVLPVEQVRKLEQMIDAGGVSLSELMKRAGHSVSDEIIKRYPDPTPVAILCGAGNNGGDGWVVAGDLAALDYPVVVLTPLIAERISAEPARTAAIEIFSSANEQQLPLRVIVSPDTDDLERELSRAHIFVDALLGTGFSGTELREPYDLWVTSLNEQRASDKKASVFAIDVPSGFSAETGQAATPCVKADITITMLTYKPGLLMNE
ncbi:MAG: NAD(P)H-hydrate epimerase, partial [Raoultibacter sp.]